jgi:signal transduction histidine kinase/ligand-binding sensor domain-containing protein
MPKSPRVRPWDRISLPPWLVVVAGLVLPSAAQEPHSIRHWGAAQGADVDLVLAIAQTPDGFLWFGSPSGLFRCNGHAFHSFDPRSEAGDSSAAISVTALLTDRAGALWIGTQFEGLYRMHQGRNETFRAPQGLDNDRIKCLLDRANGSLLVGTDGGGLFQRPTGRHRFEPFAVDAEVKLTHPTALAEAPDGTLWIGTFSDGLHAIRAGHAVHSFPRLASIKSLVVQTNGEVWVGTVAGLARVRAAELRQVPLRTAEPLGRAGSFITSMIEDSEGTLWIGTLKGLVQWTDSNETRFGDAEGLGNSLITSVFLDREGGIWAGTEIGGVHQFYHATLRLWQPYPRSGSQICHAITSDSQGWLWIAGTQGIVAWHNNQVAWTPPRGSLATEEAICLAVGRNRKVWFGSRHGKWGFIQGEEVVTIRAPESALPSQHANVILDSSRWGILVGTGRGLRRIIPSWEVVPAPDVDIPNVDITDLIEMPDGTLWAGTGVGLYRHRLGRTERVSPQAERPLEVVLDLLADADQGLWIATSRGLWHWQQNRLFAFARSQGIPAVSGPLALDHAGNLWGGAGTALVQLDRGDLAAMSAGQLQRTPHSRLWSRADGFETTLPSKSGGATPTPDGSLHFITDDGVATLRLSGLPKRSAPTSPLIEQVSINGESLDWNYWRHQAKLPSQLTLPAGYNLVEITYAAPAFRAPNRVTYAHRLRGLSDDWENIGSVRSVTYRALPPGDYEFEVIARDPEGTDHPHADRVRFAVLAPWWQQPQARLTAILGIAAILGMVYILRIRRLKRLGELQRSYSRRLLEHEENERRRLAKELHDGLGQDLLIVKNQLLLLSLTPPANPIEWRERLDTLCSSSQMAIDQARTLAHNLRPAELDRIGLTASIEAMLDRIAASSTFEIHRDIHALDGALSKDREVLLYRISQELVTNAVKHAEAKVVTVRLTQSEPGLVQLEVTDDGKGFHPDSTEPRAGESRGLGLDSVRERVEMLRGIVDLDSSPGHGTRWRVCMPVG